MGYKQGQHLALRGRDGREMRHRFRIIIAMTGFVVLDRQVQLVPHVIKIALDGLGRNLQQLSQL